ncbi:helix-turn-helix transcriptional regulator [Streptomyces olivochromogenes]|uniref:helix-turn-helix transcriptional regulator n=1 Tax=Streptomyces olivochromogenes TaxID=1963 RepID=UPI000D14F131|nr:helix-turn-helix transcriptional regulator [Streptomyces olivochromogenes]
MTSGFGDALRRLRVQAGLTQEELAERSGVSVRTIRGLETGRGSNPRMTTMQELAKALPLRPMEREELLGAAAHRNPDGDEQHKSATEEPAPEEPGSQEPGSEEPGSQQPRPAQSASGQPTSCARTPPDHLTTRQ